MLDRAIKKPVFLLGSVRSGTTMLRLLLDHHPDIAFNLESMFLISQISDDGVFPEMQTYRSWLASDRVFQHSHFLVDGNLAYKQLINDFLIQRRGAKKVVGATIHFQYQKLKLLWPDAKYIYLLRDGRDVASSVKMKGFSGNYYESSKWWLQAENEWEATKKNISDDSWIEIKYEKLTEEPARQLEDICEFIGVPYNSEMLNISGDTNYKEPDPAYNYQWRRKMPQVEVQRIESLIGDRLVERGYPLSEFPKIFISSIEEKALSLDSRLKKYAFGVKHYGVLLMLGATFSRRLRLKRLQTKISVSIDAIINKNLK